MKLVSELRTKIEAEYTRRGDVHGWGLLYGSVDTLAGADVALISLNPGGAGDATTARMSSEVGSSYEVESWAGRPPGQAPLQVQARRLFDAIGVAPDDVLAGNLVPFCSSSWADLPDRESAIEFGQGLWSSIFSVAKPSLVVTFGKVAYKALLPVLAADQRITCELGWGAVTGSMAQSADTRLVGLPHLSRFSVIGRPESELGLSTLFSDLWLGSSRLTIASRPGGTVTPDKCSPKEPDRTAK